MNHAFKNAQGEALDTSFHSGGGQATRLFVLGHGVTANKDRPFLVAIAEALARAGVDVLRLSFAGNGASEGRFEEATVTKEVADLGSVLDALEREVPQRELGYLGHSMGGAVGLLRASQDDRVRSLVCLAGMVDTQNFVRRKFGDLTPGQDCMWDKPECPLSQAFVDDLTALGSLARLGASIDVPVLLVHGDEDTVVPIKDALDLRGHTQPRAPLVEIQGADHVFSEPAHCTQAAQAISAWVRALA